MSAIRPLSASSHLTAQERAFLAAMQRLDFGRFEYLQIRDGQLILDPWPASIRDIKFGSDQQNHPGAPRDNFELKRQTREFFEYIRTIGAGEIRRLVVRHGLPFEMQIELPPQGNRAAVTGGGQ